jgi:hypothetical protein
MGTAGIERVRVYTVGSRQEALIYMSKAKSNSFDMKLATRGFAQRHYEKAKMWRWPADAAMLLEHAVTGMWLGV